MTAKVHATAIIEEGVRIGPGTSVWDNVHVRHSTRIGAECIVGEKTYIAYGVEIGDRVKINAFVYICTAVVIDDGVMVGAGTVFTNDLYPRATTPDLTSLRTSQPDDHTLPTRVREGATIGGPLHHRLRPGDRPLRHDRHGIAGHPVGPGLPHRLRPSGEVCRIHLPLRAAARPAGRAGLRDPRGGHLP